MRACACWCLRAIIPSLLCADRTAPNSVMPRQKKVKSNVEPSAAGYTTNKRGKGIRKKWVKSPATSLAGSDSVTGAGGTSSADHTVGALRKMRKQKTGPASAKKMTVVSPTARNVRKKSSKIVHATGEAAEGPATSSVFEDMNGHDYNAPKLPQSLVKKVLNRRRTKYYTAHLYKCGSCHEVGHTRPTCPQLTKRVLDIVGKEQGGNGNTAAVDPKADDVSTRLRRKKRPGTQFTPPPAKKRSVTIPSSPVNKEPPSSPPSVIGSKIVEHITKKNPVSEDTNHDDRSKVTADDIVHDDRSKVTADDIDDGAEERPQEAVGDADPGAGHQQAARTPPANVYKEISRLREIQYSSVDVQADPAFSLPDIPQALDGNYSRESEVDMESVKSTSVHQGSLSGRKVPRTGGVPRIGESDFGSSTKEELRRHARNSHSIFGRPHASEYSSTNIVHPVSPRLESVNRSYDVGTEIDSPMANPSRYSHSYRVGSELEPGAFVSDAESNARLKAEVRKLELTLKMETSAKDMYQYEREELKAENNRIKEILMRTERELELTNQALAKLRHENFQLVNQLSEGDSKDDSVSNRMQSLNDSTIRERDSSTASRSEEYGHDLLLSRAYNRMHQSPYGNMSSQYGQDQLEEYTAL